MPQPTARDQAIDDMAQDFDLGDKVVEVPKDKPEDDVWRPYKPGIEVNQHGRLRTRGANVMSW